MNEYTPLTTSSFNGIYSRSDNTKVPYSNLLDGLNLKYRDGECFTREGSSLDITLANIKRKAVYNKTGEAPRTLLLDNTGKIFDSIASLVTPILNIASMTDFSCVTVNNRCYITPHNGITGLAGEKVYVYDGTAVARAAAGTAPTNAPTATTSVTVGNVEAGLRLFAIAYVTASGHIAGISPPVEYTGPGALSVDIGNIQVGGTGIVARKVLATKLLLIYNGNPNEQEFFYIPDGELSNNVGTDKTVNFFDADLADSADILFDQLAEIPAGVGIGSYNNRLMVWGSNLQPNYCYVSKPGNPESISETEGFFKVLAGTGGLKNAFELRGLFYVAKSTKFKVVEDTGDEAAFWEVNDVDESIGTECHGIGIVLDENGKDTIESSIIASPSGLYSFDGTFFKDEVHLSHNFDKIWGRINKTYFHLIEVTVNPIDFEICVAVPLDNASVNSHVFYIDYSKGLISDSVRWCIWSFPTAPISIGYVVNFTSKIAIFRYAGTNVNKLDTSVLNDFGNAIDSYARFAFVGVGYSGQINNFGAVSALIKGSGTASITLYNLNDVLSKSLTGWTLSNPPNGFAYRQTGGFEGEKASVKIRVNQASNWFNINEFTLFAKVKAIFRPNP